LLYVLEICSIQSCNNPYYYTIDQQLTIAVTRALAETVSYRSNKLEVPIYVANIHNSVLQMGEKRLKADDALEYSKAKI
jgi:hypothetical protein